VQSGEMRVFMKSMNNMVGIVRARAQHGVNKATVQRARCAREARARGCKSKSKSDWRAVRGTAVLVLACGCRGHLLLGVIMDMRVHGAVVEIMNMLWRYTLNAKETRRSTVLVSDCDRAWV
jgi:hypothetical protein